MGEGRVRAGLYYDGQWIQPVSRQAQSIRQSGPSPKPSPASRRGLFVVSTCHFLDHHLPRPVVAAGGDEGEAHRDERVVVRSDAVVTLGSAAAAAVNEELLAVRAMAYADRLHQRAAVAEPIARERAIEVARVETERTVVTMPSARDCRSDKGPAMPALERLAPIRFATGLATVDPSIMPAFPARDPIVLADIVGRPLTCMHLGHVEFLPSTHARA